MGVRLALDDFGTGYSSLSYLRHAPFDKIKIDRSFVRGAAEKGNNNPAIIKAIVSLAEALNMETVAEGVEAMDELELVTETYVQSRGKPVRSDAIKRAEKALQERGIRNPTMREILEMVEATPAPATRPQAARPAAPASMSGAQFFGQR